MLTKVSIIMRSYNKPAYITKSIQARIKQSFTDFELLLMDDRSNLETIKAIKHFLMIRELNSIKAISKQ